MIEKKLKELISEQLGIQIEKISNDLDIIADLNADSLDQVELVLSIEKEFKIHIDDSEYATNTIVSQIVKLIEQKQGL